MSQNTLAPAILSASPALQLLLGTTAVALPSCFATALSDTAVPAFASGLVSSYCLHCSPKYSEYY